jgi:hypothetical protein
MPGRRIRGLPCPAPRIWFGVTGLLLATLLPDFARADTASCGEFHPCEQRLRLGAIESVKIERNAQAVSGREEASVDCARFRLTPKQVRRYLTSAGRITENARHYVVSESPCNAMGEVTYRSAKRATWIIGMLKEGRLVFTNADGSSEQMDLYCGRCAFPPFID